ncbi:hypothetical protein DXG01_008349 [Tephrocybe rancida]|nr:hypothetical protein DXG01_008349 [Tephrocybe rancida]
MATVSTTPESTTAVNSDSPRRVSFLETATQLTHPSLPPCPEPSTIPLPPQSRPVSANHSHRSNNILRPTPIHPPSYDRPYSPPRPVINTFGRVPFQLPYPLPHHDPLDPHVSYTKPVRFVFTLEQSVHEGAFSDHLHSTIRVVTEDAEERTFLIIEDISPVVQPQFRYPFPNISIRDLLENYPPRTDCVERITITSLQEAWTTHNNAERDHCEQETEARNAPAAQGDQGREGRQQQQQQQQPPPEPQQERAEPQPADEELTERKCKARLKLRVFNPQMRVGNTLAPRPSSYAINKLSNFEYCELWYFSMEGCEDALRTQQTEADDSLGISKTGELVTLRPVASVQASKQAIQDEELS